MSTIAGILRPGGGAVDPLELHRLAAALSHRVADEAAVWADGPVGLAARLWRTTPEAEHEHQPHHAPAAHLALVLDGRLDNRDDLRRALRGHADLAAAATDAEILAAAYTRWGVECAAHLLGDFAFAIWDRRAKRLCCGRDILGIRPFFYRVHADRFAWASEPHALLRYDGTTPKPNERMVGEYLTIINDKQETLLAGVLRLPPAHALVVDAQGLRTWKYWDVDPGREIRYADDREYVEHLRAIMTEAVRAQTRSSSPIGVMLSGGIDSSSVLALAQSVRTHGPAIDAYSIAVDGPEDESAYFREAAASAGARSIVTVAGQARRMPAADEVARYLDVPMYPNVDVATPLREQARDHGVRVLLSGLGPDEWLRGSEHHYADQFRRGELVALLRGMRQDARRKTFPGWRRAARMTVWPLLPPRAQQRVRRVVRKRRCPAVINPEFGRRLCLDGRLAQGVPDPGFPTRAQYDMYRGALSGADAHGLEMLDRSCSSIGIEMRHPFNDRRLIEFGLAIPEAQRWRDGQPKYLLRRVAEPLVPATVRRRFRSPDYSRTLVRELERHGAAALIASLKIAEQGWVNQPQVAAMHRDMTRRAAAGDPRYRAHLWTLWMVIALELWFRTAIAGASAARADSANV